jgi:hypothetical protein
MHELHRQFCIAGARGRPLDELCVDIHAGHLAAGSHAPCKLEGGVSGSGANIEHAQSSFEIERPEQRFHRRMKRKDLVVCAVAIRVDIDPVLLVVGLGHSEARSDEAQFLQRDAQLVGGTRGHRQQRHAQLVGTFAHERERLLDGNRIGLDEQRTHHRQ